MLVIFHHLCFRKVCPDCTLHVYVMGMNHSLETLTCYPEANPNQKVQEQWIHILFLRNGLGLWGLVPLICP